MTLPRYQSFVDGRALANTSGETFTVVNPATGEAIYEMEVADEGVRAAALASAQRGFAQWSATPAIERSRIR